MSVAIRGLGPVCAFVMVACGGADERPSEARPLEGIVELSAGFDFTCARLSNGESHCWGRNFEGELGNGSTVTTSPTPVKVRGLGQVTALDTGFTRTCAVTAGGSVNCWGDAFGISQIDLLTPVTVSAPNARSISVGSQQGCIVADDSTVWCFGASVLWLGADPDPMVAAAVDGLTDVRAVAGGDGVSCAILEDKTVACWGGLWGQLSSATPVQVEGFEDVDALSVGTFSGCAVLADASVECWGYNSLGALGNGTDEDALFEPVPVSGLGDAVSISVGDNHACALLADGSVWCWGSGFGGLLGNGAEEDSSVPVQVDGIDDAVAVTAGDTHSCALLSDGTARCWGGNIAGGLGDGTTRDSPVPVVVRGAR